MTATARQKSLVVPREHGAWGILLIPLVTGAGAGLLTGGSAASLLPLTIAVLALFWLRTPVESWMGTAPIRARAPSEIQLVRNAAFALAAVSLGSLLWLFWGGRNPVLLAIGAAAAVAFLAQAAVKRTWRSARTAAQMIGAAGLTSTAPVAYCAITGGWSVSALALWGANFLFAVNQIHFVQLRIHAVRAANRAEKLSLGRRFLMSQFLLIALLSAACSVHAFPWYSAVAFAPVLFRGFAWFAAGPQPLAIYALGKSELVYACLFGLLLVLGMAVA